MANPAPLPVGVPEFDQRGYPYQRIADGDGVGGAQIDMGAFEWQQFTPAVLPGDYNLNGLVDAADYTVWRDLLGTRVAPYSSADGNGNGTVDAADHVVWVTNFGQSLPAAGRGGGAILAVSGESKNEVEPRAESGIPLVIVSGAWFPSTTSACEIAKAEVEGGSIGESVRQDEALLAWLTSLETIYADDVDLRSPTGRTKGASLGHLPNSLQLLTV